MDINNQRPCSKEAEYAVIGSVLVNPACFREIDLAPDDFYFGNTKETWKIFQELSVEKKVIDPLIVIQRASEKNLESAIGLEFLSETMSETPSSVNYETYAEIVKEKSKRRELIQIANDLAKYSFDERTPIDDHIPETLNKLINSSRADKSTEHISKSLSNLLDDIQARSENPKDVWGFSTGIPGLDRITGGFQPGEAVMVTGEPGLGKSLLSIQIGFHMAKEGIPGAIFEMEMNNLQTLRRQLSIESGVKVTAMKSGRLQDDEYSKLVNGVGVMESMPVYISDASSWTSSSIRSELTRLKLQHKVKWFVLDYLMLLKDRYGSNEIERQNYMSIAVKDICKDLDMAGIIINSVNKQGVTSGSKQIQHDMDLIISMEMSKENTDLTMSNPLINLLFNKQREGEGGKTFITLVKKQGFPCFAEMVKPQFARDHVNRDYMERDND